MFQGNFLPETAPLVTFLPEEDPFRSGLFQLPAIRNPMFSAVACTDGIEMPSVRWPVLGARGGGEKFHARYRWSVRAGCIIDRSLRIDWFFSFYSLTSGCSVGERVATS